MRLFPALAAAMLSIALPGAAHATSVYLTGNAVGPYPIGNFERDGVLWTSAGITQYRYVGNYVPGGVPVEFLGYCVDFLQPEITGLFELAPLSARFSAERATLLNTLLGNAAALETAASDDNAKLLIRTATQLAIWELSEESSSTLAITGDGFKAFDADDSTSHAAARILADDYLLKAASVWTPVAGKQARLLYNPELQSAVYLAAIPEPATWATMIGGMGLAGGALRRRRQVRAAA